MKEAEALEVNYKAIQAENYQLRDYIINLQSRLIESQGEYPQPPSNIDLPNPRSDDMDAHMTGPAVSVPTAPMGAAAVTATAENQLQASAAATAQALAAAEAKHVATQDDAAAAAAQLVSNVIKAAQGVDNKVRVA